MHGKWRAALFAAWGLVSVPALALGPGGHMAVGSIADELIAGTAAGKQARKILGTNLRTASVWADCVKGVNPKTFKYGGAGNFAECAVYENAASKKLLEAFVRRNAHNCNSAHNTEVCHKQYHYTDVAIQRTAYEKGKVGTSEHDIVAATAAAIAVLQGKASPAPFNIANKKEALRLLSHYVGDIHQPLHVAAVYLDKTGKLVDPDNGHFDPQTETRGGNDLLIGSKRLHAEWDSVVGPLTSQAPSAQILAEARAIPSTAGPVLGWSSVWATESLALGKPAFEGVQFSAEDAADHHQIKLPAGYSKTKARVQHDQVVKAGARLAQILRAVWPG